MSSSLLLKAVILSIDSAAVSGVAISVPEFSSSGTRVQDYEVVSCGLARSQDERQSWAADAALTAKDEDLPLLAVGEQWTRHGLSSAAYASLCERWGMWLAALEIKAPGALVVRALPEQWRDAVFGKRRAQKREDLKHQAVQYAATVLKMPLLEHDIAEALCLRVWASRCDTAHALLAAAVLLKIEKKKPKKRAG